MPALVGNNVVGWLAQILILGTAGALLPILFRIRHARSQLVYSHLILAVCLVLPLIQPWQEPAASPAALTLSSPPVTTVGSVVPAAPASGAVSWTGVLVWILAAGTLVRLGWLGAGLLRIRRYRAASRGLDPVSGAVSRAREIVGADARFLLSPDIAGPVTFGFFRPVVLLPETFPGMTETAQFGIACHELLHVRRRDWLATLAEEAALSIVWFHPGLWWLVLEARLAREQIVDSAVARRMADRESYVEALLEMAGNCRRRRVPVAMFSNGRELKWRVRALLSEVSMSRIRLFLSYAAVAALVVLAGWAAFSAFPLLAEPAVPEILAAQETAAESTAPPAPNALRSEVAALSERLQEVVRGGVQAEPVPGGRGQRGGVLPTLGGVYFGAQTPVEESEPGVVRLRAIAGRGVTIGLSFNRRVRQVDALQGELSEVTEGEVTVLLTFNADGQIVDSRVSSGPDSLRLEALQTVLGQNYDVRSPRVLQVVVEFIAPPPPPPPAAVGGAVGGAGRGGPRGGGGGGGAGPAPQ
jgi:beta-lactamase regulating signal transducer with metallopeptidase domain